MGNLYRTINTKGHIRWICIDHFRERYSETALTAFRGTVESLGGSFNENLGRVKVTLHSRDQADQHYLASEEAKFIYELENGLHWDTTYDDLKGLRDVLLEINVGILKLDLNYIHGPDSDSLNHARRYNPILDIMRHTSIKSVTLVRTLEDFIKQSNLSSCPNNFSNLKHLGVDMTKLCLDIPGLRSLVAKSPNLDHLVLVCDSERFLSVYNAIAEYQSCPITFPNQTLRILLPTNDYLQPLTDVKDMSDLLKVHGGEIERVKLGEGELLEPIVAAFAKATEGRSKLKDLILGKAKRSLGEQSIKILASIVAQSELRMLHIHLEDERERVHILESIQWKHILGLVIRMDDESLGMSPLKALVDGIKEFSGRVYMEHLEVQYEVLRRTLPIVQGQLVRSVVALTSPVCLQLLANMTLEQALSLLVSDISQLQRLAV